MSTLFGFIRKVILSIGVEFFMKMQATAKVVA
jgi:hypothetical protein